MRYRTRLRRLAALKSLGRHDSFRPLFEPLEERRMLSDVPPDFEPDPPAKWTNSGPVALAASALIVENANMASMTVSLSSPQPGDSLNATAIGNITVAGNGTGTLVFTGLDSTADYQSELQAITYNNANGGPGVYVEYFTATGIDALGGVSNTLTGTVNIQVPPVVLLNNPMANNTTSFTNAGPVAIGNPGQVSVTDGESGNLVSLTASITNLHAGDVLTDSVAGTSITSSYNAGTGVLTLSGSDTLAHYQQVLGTITYNNTIGSPDVAAETVSVVASDVSYSSAAALATININVGAFDGVVAGIYLFYDNSKFNHNVEGVNAASDDKAIDPTKTAYLPGAGTATFANLSSFTNGINGVMVDLAGSATHTAITAGDFTFKVGDNNKPSMWATAPPPSTVSVRTGTGTSGSDRVEITWTDGSIKEEWLEVTVHADPNTGLAAPYTFFYGSVIANSGIGNSGALAITSSTDENAARSHNGSATVSNVFDYNKDGFVNSSDENAARNNGATIKFIKIAANTPLAPDAAPSVAPDVSVAPAVTSGTSAAAAGSGDTGLASGLASLLGSLKTGTLPPLRLDWLSSELTNVNLNSGAAATIFEGLAVADTKLTRSILVEADKVADELGLDDGLLDSILADLGLE